MPEVHEVDSDLVAKWDRFLTLRDDVLKALEEARKEKTIGKSLEAKVTLYVENADDKAILDSMDHLHQLFITSQAEVVDEKVGNDYAEASVLVEKADGEKCERCWNYSTELNDDHLCPRCAAVVAE